MRTVRFAAALFLSFICFQTPGFSQTGGSVSSPQPSTLVGLVTDASGAAVPGATVSLETSSGVLLQTSVTDASGHYTLSVKPDAGMAYREQTSATGFRSVIVDRLILGNTQHQVQDIQLMLGAVTETTTVTANQDIGNGQIATSAQIGILGTLSEADTPYSVSSYTAQLVLDQQAQTESDILRNEVGIQEANGRYSEDNYLTLRGFALDSGQSLLNGIAGLVDNRSPSIENVETIEIFKGPSAFLNGASSSSAVGGTVNLVTKRAPSTPFYRFDGGYTSNREFEGHLDVAHRFLHNEALGVRANVGGRFGKTPIDNQEENIGAATTGIDYRGQKLQGSLDVSDEVRSMVAERDSIYVLPGFAIPAAPKLTSNLFDHSSSYVKHVITLLGQGNYSLNTHVNIYGAYGFSSSPESYVGPNLTYLSDTQGDVQVQNLPFTADYHNRAARLGTQIRVATGPIEHNITVAGDLVDNNAGYFYEYLDIQNSNIYHPVALAPLSPRVAGLKNLPDTDRLKLSSVAIADIATALKGKLIVIGGVRAQRLRDQQLGSIDRSAQNTVDFEACTDACLYSRGVFSPSIAALYHLTSKLSVYGNFLQDLQEAPSAPTGAVNENQVFAPEVAKQEEAGLKFEAAHAGATLALFRITEPNGVLNPVTNVYAISGQERNDGLELSVFGNITPSLRLISGISFINALQFGTGDPTTENKKAEGVPVAQTNIGAEWTAPRLRTLVLSSRVTASSGQYADTAETQRVPAWGRLDVGGRYTFEGKIPTTIRVNIDNVTGANYFESAFQGLAYSGPRTIRISGGWRF